MVINFKTIDLLQIGIDKDLKIEYCYLLEYLVLDL